MNPQLRRRLASAALIIGFFVAWEVLCLMFGVKDLVLPRPTITLRNGAARVRPRFPTTSPGRPSRPSAPFATAMIGIV